LVPNRENADFIAGDHKSVQRYVSGMPVGNDQLAQLAFEAPSYERVRGEIVDSRSDGRHGTLCGIGVFVTQKLERALDVIESSR
jgi:hypothetical protein